MRLREPLPELSREASWLSGQVKTRSELVGEKPVLIYFWSVSCGTCTRGIDQVTALFNEYKEDMHVITVHLPRKEEDRNIANVKRYIEQHHLNEPVIIDQTHEITNQFKNRYVPAFYLFDKAGKLRFIQAGKSTVTILKKRLERLLKE